MIEQQAELPLTDSEEVVASSSLPILNVNPSEFGVELAKAANMQQAFTPFIIEMQAYDVQYADIVNSEITPTLCKQAKELRNKYVKVRTGIGRAHKAEKEFYLAGGKFVDAIKNRGSEASTTRETKLLEIETYFEKLEEERLRQLAETRKTELSQYTSDIPTGLDTMLDSVYGTFLLGAKKDCEDRVERERIETINSKRIEELRLYWDFVSEEAKLFDFGNLPDEQYNALLTLSIKAKTDKEAEELKAQQDKDAELERLRLESSSNQKNQEKLMIRCSELASFGLKFNSATAIYEGNGNEVRNTEIQSLGDAKWLELINQIKEAFEQTLTIEIEPEVIPTPVQVTQPSTPAQPTTRRVKIINWVKSYHVDNLPPELANDPDAVEILAKINGCKQWINSKIKPIND